MLAKVAPPSNDFHALARYLVRGKPGTTADPRRVAWVFSQNLPTDDPELAATYMAASAQLSQRTKNAAYHLMIAWHERERPTPELMQLIARQTLVLAGVAEHQALIMGHGDKPHPHLHILLNRVHPDTGRAWKTTHDFARLDRIMKQLAADHGCEHLPAHAYNPELTDELPKRPKSRAVYAAKRGARTNRFQWSRKDSRKLGKDISEDLTQVSTPEDVEDALADRGLALEQKGKGFVVGNADGYAKVSSLGLKGSAQGDRFIEFASHRVDQPSRSRRSIFHVDAIDIAKAFHTIGLVGKQEVRDTIAEVVAERQTLFEAKPIPQQLVADLRQHLKVATALTPARKTITNGQTKHPRASARAKAPSGR
ncbi:relaxase/mobilization nuclease domain-containing protein [Hyphomicrobium sp. LHD-15]|uniref:relaxase/mobilization nuclease domain-containing protein n=1 Tax=Hyphomicrobium sp. LHD-15 TaxID=3072142 RepID=UPI00280E7FCB|nr:relaxase/mobilization nuclease domain-containing protein [Hyphomicrobium sp. LHD-15]MDQ8699273.1 relaxase/mobilization nuclease domain-containing protein [Hyphomicrobium sp. LHD-15]